MPTYRFIDYNELTSKPADVDMFAIYDIDANELKKFSYGTLKSLFVKKDEPTDVEATVEFQSTATKPNSLLKFGSAGEFRIYSDGVDLFVKGTNAAGKLRFYANSIEMFSLNPTNSSIATLGMAINKDGASGVGINFNASNEPVLLSILRCNAGIAANIKNISFSGLTNTGLTFNTASDATFKQKLTVESTLDVNGQINANKIGDFAIDATGNCIFRDNVRFLSWLSRDGQDEGMLIDDAGNVQFSDNIEVIGNANAVGYFKTTNGYFWSVNSYLRGTYIIISDGITPPDNTIGQAKIYVDTADGDLKVKFGNGFVAVLASDS